MCDADINCKNESYGTLRFYVDENRDPYSEGEDYESEFDLCKKHYDLLIDDYKNNAGILLIRRMEEAELNEKENPKQKKTIQQMLDDMQESFYFMMSALEATRSFYTNSESTEVKHDKKKSTNNRRIHSIQNRSRKRIRARGFQIRKKH